MINSKGDKIKMEVHDLIPYVYLGAKDYRPSPDHEAELVMKVLGLMGNDTASRTVFLDGESGDEMSESDDGVGTYGSGRAGCACAVCSLRDGSFWHGQCRPTEFEFDFQLSFEFP